MVASSQPFAVMVMGASAGHVYLAPQVLAMRNPSSDLDEPANDDSNFEFDFSQAYSTDEPPVSPKLQAFSPDWTMAAPASMMSPTRFSAEHIYAAMPDTHYVDAIDAFGNDADSDTIKSTHKLPTGMISTSSDQSQKVRVDLRSLMLERRERDQLPPIVGTHQSNDGVATADRSNADGSKPLRSSPYSCSSSPSLESSSSSSSQHHSMKSKRWSLKLDFLQTKKGSCCPSKTAVDHPHLHRAAAANQTTAMIDELREGNDFNAVDNGDNMGGYGDGKVESPRQSTCSLSSMSSAGAPVSPVGSPSRASIAPSQLSGTATGHLLYANGRRPPSPVGPAGGVKRPMSPHAQHYQQQRARAEELGRRTSLPYRQSLFGACFFLPSRPQVTC
ncbi:hypothetical protein L7F22_027552 [Adiantum nelumboides]|nr:hypothetical protein [Adiantum nelumboides]